MTFLYKPYVKLIINCLAIFSLCFYSHKVSGQIFDVEQVPPSVKWRQINTENFQVIYPLEFEEEAMKLTSGLENMMEAVSRTLGKKPRKISIILQSRMITSNGFVQLAPRRSEFHTTPPQLGDYQEWLNYLAIHELRHVVQFDKLTGYLRAPLFEQLALAIFGVTLPSWFFEGDAVLTETVLTNSGRGRLPSWEMPFRTNLLSGRNFSYQKDYMGSLKDLTPGFYELGYFMVTKMQRDYGEHFLDSLMTRMAGNPIRPYNLSTSLRKFTGYNTRDWHRETTRELKEKWEHQLAVINPDTYPVFPEVEQSTPQSWLLPQRLPNGHILALYQSAKDVPALVLLDTSGNQRRLINTGRQTNPNFSYSAGRISWDEIRTHSRYSKQTYSVINLYDLEKGQYKQLTHRSRLFSPTLSADGHRIAAVEIDRSNVVSIVLLDAENGDEIKRFPSPNNIMIQTPAFHPASDKIIATGISGQGAALIELDLTTDQYTTLLDWQAQQIERPVYHIDGQIFFKAHYNGLDNIYALDPASHTIRQVTNARFGAFNPSVDYQNNALLFNHYQTDGHRISHLSLKKNSFRSLDKTADSFINYFKPLLRDVEQKWITDTNQTKTGPSRPYRELSNLFNFHSLSVMEDNPSSFSDLSAGIYWLSDNLLNTTQIRLGYEYDGDIRSTTYNASLSYQRFFPKFTAEYRNRGQVGTARIQSEGGDSLLSLRWRENITTLRMDIPLVFYRLNQVYNTGVSVATNYTDRYGLNHAELENRFVSHIAFPMNYMVYVNRNNRRSLLDLAPRWGQNLSATYRHLPFDGRSSGDIFSFRSSFYFPGILRNHSLQMRFNYQEGSGVYRGINDIPLVSGFDRLRPSQVDNTLLFSYRLPIAYPDWSIGPLAYIKRFKGGFFADFQNVRSGAAFRPRTFGIEFRSDMNLLRYYLPNFDAGIKLVFANESDASQRVFATYSISYSY